MIKPSTIFRIAAKNLGIGKCDICAERGLINWRDAASDHSFGDCCINDVLLASRTLDAIEGVRPPKISELPGIANL